MRRFSKTIATLAVSAATLALAGCGGHGPNTYLMSKDDVVAKLTGAEREYDFGGKDKRIVKAISRSGDNLKVKVTYTTGALGSVMCEAQIEAIDEEWTRVTPVCPKSTSAADNLQAEVYEMQVDEWVLAVLYNREVDTAMVLKRTSAIVIDNFGDVAEEAGDEIQAAAEEQERATLAAEMDSGGWEDSGGSDWGN